METLTQHSNFYPGYQAATFPIRMDSDSKDGFDIQSFDSMDGLQLLEPDRQPLVRFEIVWFIEVEGSISIDAIQQTLQSQTVYCFVPGQVRQYQLTGTMQGYRIAFSQDFVNRGGLHRSIESWMDMAGVEPHALTVRASEEMQDDLQSIIRKMQKEYLNYYLLRSEILCGLLNILLIHLSRTMNVKDQGFALSKDRELVQKFKALLKRDFLTRKQVGDYASELCVTANYLNRTVKKITGFTASHHIQQQIILEAKRKAIHSNVSMKEIAYFLGFDNLAHFSKFFKNNSGMNFTSFKKLQAS